MRVVGIEKEEGSPANGEGTAAYPNLPAALQHKAQLQGPVDMGVAGDDLHNAGLHMIKLGVSQYLIFLFAAMLFGHRTCSFQKGKERAGQ
jgi:hypothetical protein